MRRPMLSTALAALLAAAMPARAQDIGNRSPVETRPPQRSEAPDLRFTTSSDLRRQTVMRQVEAMRATDATGAAQVQAQLAQHDYDTIFRGFTDGTGHSAEDAGDVLTLYTALQWMIANDVTADPTPAALKALRSRQVLPVALASGFADENKRAALAETIKLKAVLLHAGWQAARQAGTAEAFADAVSETFSKGGALKRLALTDEGFVPRQGKPASSAATAEHGRIVEHANDAGIVVRIEAEGGQGARPEQRLTEMLARMERSLGRVLPGTPIRTDTSGGHAVAMVARRFARAPETVHLLLTTESGSGVCHLSGPAGPRTQAALPAALQACNAELLHQMPATAAPDSAPTALAAPVHAANWDAVEGVYFRSTTGVGVGGMVTLDFEPVVLFRDGTSYEIADTALEDIDLAAERRAKPARFGSWSNTGARYTLTRAGGKPYETKLQDGSFFKAFAAEPGGSLDLRYQRLSGGGNTALGGGTMIAISSRYAFSADGRYDRGGHVGATDSGGQSGVSSTLSSARKPEAGHYVLDRHTLTLTAADGRQTRRFFAFASQKNPPRIDRDMIFIGDSVFTSEK